MENKNYSWEKNYETTCSILNCQTVGDIKKRIIIPVCKSMDASSGVFGHWDASSSLLDDNLYDGFRVSSKTNKQYHERFHLQDPIMEAVQNRLINPPILRRRVELLCLHDICDFHWLQSTDYYQDFLRPTGVHHIVALAFRPSLLAPDVFILGIHRRIGDRPFTTNDFSQLRLLGNAILPVVSKIALEKHLERDKALIDTLEENSDHLGIIILNQNYEHVYSNKLAGSYFPVSQDKKISGKIGKELTSCCNKLKSAHDHDEQKKEISSLELEIGPSKVKCDVELRYNEMGNLFFVIIARFVQMKDIIYNRGKEKGLTSRELEISLLVSEGLTNSQISQELGISTRTTETHLRTIYTKLNIHNRTGMINRLTYY